MNPKPSNDPIVMYREPYGRSAKPRHLSELPDEVQARHKQGLLPAQTGVITALRRRLAQAIWPQD